MPSQGSAFEGSPSSALSKCRPPLPAVSRCHWPEGHPDSWLQESVNLSAAAAGWQTPRNRALLCLVPKLCSCGHTPSSGWRDIYLLWFLKCCVSYDKTPGFGGWRGEGYARLNHPFKKYHKLRNLTSSRQISGASPAESRRVVPAGKWGVGSGHGVNLSLLG